MRHVHAGEAKVGGGSLNSRTWKAAPASLQLPEPGSPVFQASLHLDI